MLLFGVMSVPSLGVGGKMSLTIGGTGILIPTKTCQESFLPAFTGEFGSYLGTEIFEREAQFVFHSPRIGKLRNVWCCGAGVWDGCVQSRVSGGIGYKTCQYLREYI